jgi:hypothetical protein
MGETLQTIPKTSMIAAMSEMYSASQSIDPCLIVLYRLRPLLSSAASRDSTRCFGGSGITDILPFLESRVIGKFPQPREARAGGQFTEDTVFMEMLGRFLVLFKKPEKALSAE